VVLKGEAAHLPHKTEHGLVRLGLASAAEVGAAWAALEAKLRALSPNGESFAVVLQPMLEGGVELVIALRDEPGFGPIVVVGPGGVFVELIGEVAVRLAPVDAAEAAAMLRETRAGALLAGFRGQGPFDLEAAAAAIAALSRLGIAARGI